MSVGKVELKQDWFGLVWVGRGLGWAGPDRLVCERRSQVAGWLEQTEQSRAGQIDGEKIEQALLCDAAEGGQVKGPGSYVVVMRCRKVTVKIQAGCCRMKVRNVLTQPEQIDAAREDGYPYGGGRCRQEVLVYCWCRLAEREDPGSDTQTC